MSTAQVTISPLLYKVKNQVKRAVAGLAPAPADPGFRILLYHAVDAVDPEDQLSLRVPPEEFRAQMKLLKAEGYRVVPVRSLLDGQGRDDTVRVAITFDDGYQSQLHAAAILEEFGFPATFFVVIRFLNGEQTGDLYWERWKHMGWKDLRALSGRSFEIGAHSFSHRYLTRCLPSELEREVKGAKSCLEERLGQSVMSFSYPHGAYNDAVRRAVQESGYRLACTSVLGTNHDPWPWFELRRTEISGAGGLRDFDMKLRGKYDWLGYWQQWQAGHD